MSDQRRIRAKICFVGTSGVGKTSLIRRSVEGDFKERYIPTPSTVVTRVEYAFPEKDGCELILELDIWDINGQKAFRKFLADSYFFKARLIVGVCDSTRKDTLYDLREWIDMGLEVTGKVPVHVLANKSDTGYNAILYDPTVKQISENYDSPFCYVSAMTGQNVDSSFHEIAERVLGTVIDDVEEEEKVMRFEWEILNIIVGKGRLGASKDMFFQMMKGIAFDKLRTFLELLEEKELIRVKWSGSSNFVAFATDEGIRVAELGPRRVEDERIDTVVG